MRLKREFETMRLNDHIIAVPVGDDADYHGVLKLNETAAFIFDLLKTETTVDAIVEKLEKEYDAPRETLEEDVKKYIAEFQERGFLV